MTVNDKYRLGALVRSGEVATFEAREISTGRSLYVHLMAGAGAAASLAAQVRRLAAGPRDASFPVVEQGEYEGAPFVVTTATPDLLDLKRWIESQPPAAVGPQLTEPVPSGPLGAAEPSREPGEFTRLFQSTAGEEPAAESRPKVQAESPRPQTPSTVPAEPDEFTRMFGASGAEPEPRPVAPPPPPAPAPDPPGETRKVAPAAATPAGHAGGEGEFTRLFRESQPGPPAGASAPPANTQVSPKAPVARPGPSVPPPASSPLRSEKPYEEPSTWQTGEFTSLFQPGKAGKESPGPAAPPRPAEPSVTDSGAFRKVSPQERRQEMRQFRMVTRPGAEAAKPTPATGAENLPAHPPGRQAPSAPTPPGPANREPGEFTRMFQGGGPAPGTQARPPAPPPAAQPPSEAADRRSATQLGGPGSTSAPPKAPVDPPPPVVPTLPGERARPVQPPDWTHKPPQPPSPSSDRFSMPYETPAGAGGGEVPKVEQTGEFTKLFRQTKPPSGRHEPIGPPPPFAPSPPVAPAPPAGSPGSGEFTQLFGSGRSAPVEPDPFGALPQSPSPRSSEGDFTRVFGGGSAQGSDLFAGGSAWPGQTPPATIEPENQPGDFTKLFGGKSRGSGGPGVAGSGRATGWREPKGEPGGATQMSRSPSAPPQAPPPPPSDLGPSDYTRMMGNAPPPPRQQAPVTQTAAPPPVSVPPPAPPTAYAPPAPTPPPVAAPPAPAPPTAAAQPSQRPQRDAGASERSMYLILALLFCALLIVALGIVLFVSLTGDRGEQPAPPAQTGQAEPQAPATGMAPGGSGSLGVPGVRPPSVTSPSLRAPSVTPPSVSASGISAGSVAPPSVSAPSVSAPSASVPRLPSASGLPAGQPATAAAQPSVQPAASDNGGTPFFALIIVLSILLVIAVGAAVYFALRRA